MTSFADADKSARILLLKIKGLLNQVPDSYLDSTEVAGQFHEITQALAEAGIHGKRAAAVVPTIEGAAGAVTRIEELFKSARMERAAAEHDPSFVDEAAARAAALAQGADDACATLAKEYV